MAKHKARTHAVSLVVPSDEPRKARRERVRAERRMLQKADVQERSARREAHRVEQEARKTNPYLPTSGESGPAAGRTYRALKVQPHRATSATLAATYPFLAEAGLGSEGILIGTDAFSRRSFVFDPWELYKQGIITNPNVAVAGEIGAGKSSLMKSLTSRSLCFQRRTYVPADPKGEWTGVTRAVGGAALELGPGMTTRINPLDAGARPATLPENEWRQEVRLRRLTLLTSLTETLARREILPVEHTALGAAVDHTTRTTQDPTLPQVVQHLLDPDPGSELPPGVSDHHMLAHDGREVGHALARLVLGDLVGLFDKESTARFDPSLPMVSIDVSRIGEDNPLIPLVMTCTSAWMEAALRDPAGGRRWVVYDEAWNVMRNPALVRRMETQWRLSRGWGLSNILAIHQLADFNAVGEHDSQARAQALSLLALTSTRIVYRQLSDQLANTSAAMGLNKTESDLLTGLVQGRALWRIGTRSFVVQHMLTDREKKMFDTDARMVEREAIPATPAGVMA